MAFAAFCTSETSGSTSASAVFFRSNIAMRSGRLQILGLIGASVAVRWLSWAWWHACHDANPNARTLLDELNKPYVITARARSATGQIASLKVSVRIAITHPFISTVGLLLPTCEFPVKRSCQWFSICLRPDLLLRALLAHDMYLAGSSS